MFLALFLISMIGVVSAKTLIAGKIYNADYSDTISGADVLVTCDGTPHSLVTSSSDGTYSVTYDDEEQCGYGDTLNVYAEKDGLSGYKEGTIHENAFDTDWDLAIVNVPLVPEFGFFIGGLTIVSAIAVFFFVRKQ